MPKRIRVFAGCTSHFVDFVMLVLCEILSFFLLHKFRTYFNLRTCYLKLNMLQKRNRNQNSLRAIALLYANAVISDYVTF